MPRINLQLKPSLCFLKGAGDVIDGGRCLIYIYYLQIEHQSSIPTMPKDVRPAAKLHMEKQVSRYEINRMVRQVLIKHNVDLTQLQFSCSGVTVYLYGYLLKDTEGKFTPESIEAMVKELSRLPHVKSVQFDLHNWRISSDIGAWQIAERK